MEKKNNKAVGCMKTSVFTINTFMGSVSRVRNSSGVPSEFVGDTSNVDVCSRKNISLTVLILIAGFLNCFRIFT